MSKGGRYILQQNEDGTVQDIITLNLSLLEKRLDEIRKKNCESAVKPLYLSELAEKHNVFVKKYYKPVLPVAYEWTNEPLDSGFSFVFGGTNRFLLPLYGDFIGETILYFKFSGLSTVSPLDKCGYYDFLGHRIMQYVSLEFSGDIIDEYYSDAYNMYYNYHVPQDKKKSWLRAVGQEFPEEAILRQSSTDEVREVKNILCGPQTAKRTHDVVELWIPILFDYSIKPHCALFSAAIPVGQRYINVTAPSLSSLIYVEDNGGGGNIIPPTVECSMWINQFFIHPAIVNDLKKSEFRTTIRTFKTQFIAANTSGSQKLDLIRLQAEDIYIGLRPNINTGPSNWWRFHTAIPQNITYPVRVPFTGPADQLTFAQAKLYKPQSSLTSLSFTSHGIQLNNVASRGFYNIVQPLCKSIAPSDIGLLMYTFAQKNNQTVFPDISENDDITSYYNISNQREFYLDYTADSAALPGTIVVIARVINWLIINLNGRVEIKYKN